MLKFIGGTVDIIFLIDFLVVLGLLALIFEHLSCCRMTSRTGWLLLSPSPAHLRAGVTSS
ncbi:hypothetical protein [Sulfitobacter sp. 915]|jgi:hypothetical protein|uniref:hypothetical protein n=1 Tax=Sulfitobacter sp. 915 TaxID=3368558 RepID=UPI003747204C